MGGMHIKGPEQLALIARSREPLQAEGAEEGGDQDRQQDNMQWGECWGEVSDC